MPGSHVSSLRAARAPLAATAAVLSAVALAGMTGCAPAGDDGTVATREGDGLGGDSALIDLFREAEARTGVPAEILAAISYSETRLRFVDGWGHHGHGGAPAIGLMALEATGPRSVARAAALTSLGEEALYVDPLANVLGGAALLLDLAGSRAPDERAGWRDALVAYGGGGAPGHAFAREIERHLAAGFRGLDAEGRWLVLSARPLRPAALGDEEIGATRLALGYPGAIWNPAYSGNYQNASRGAGQINYVIIHTVQGSYSGAISWFKNSAANVSAHYVTRSSDGQITQMVDDADIAWHDACFNSETIGIEHEGYVQDPDAWYTEAMYMESAKLTAWLCDQYGIPKDRAHIMGHGEAPDCSDHYDPGSGWDWDHYMALVQSGGQPRFDAAAAAADLPTQMVSGEERVVWFEFRNDSNVTWGLNETRLGTADPQDRESPFFVDGNWLSPSRATGADHSNYGPGATGRFT
ncbi:MAG TPA: peptidoglycan recognition family protein, partial [Kofleriaceae bacterium]|nr:peptidoglycan recognition family protein [Kofleriaceae bacterium]